MPRWNNEYVLILFFHHEIDIVLAFLSLTKNNSGDQGEFRMNSWKLG